MTPDIVVLGAGGWHWQRLAAALDRCGLAALRLPATACALDLGGGAGGPAAGPARRRLPGRCWCGSSRRARSSGSRCGSACCTRSRPRACVVVNGPTAIERCVDKAATSFRLALAGLPTPPTWAVEHREAARAMLERERAAGHAVVLKPLFGAQGKGLRLLRGPRRAAGRGRGRRRLVPAALCRPRRGAGATSGCS